MDNEYENAFKELKKRLTTSSILLHSDFTKPFIVECEASSFVIDAVLSKWDKENNMYPVAYYSKSLLIAEVNYTITNKELFAIRDAFIAWRHPLLSAK